MKHNPGLANAIANALRPLRDSLRAVRLAMTRLDERVAALDRRVALLEQRLAAKPSRHVPAAVAAELLGVDVRTVRRWIETGQLDGLVLPGVTRRRWVVAAFALERLLEPSAPNVLPAARAAPEVRNRGAAAQRT